MRVEVECAGLTLNLFLIFFILSIWNLEFGKGESDLHWCGGYLGYRGYWLPCCKIAKEIPYLWCHGEFGCGVPTILVIIRCKWKFQQTFDVIKVAFSNPKKLADNDVWVPEVVLISSLNIEQSMFKLAMKSNACVVMAKTIDVNPL